MPTLRLTQSMLTSERFRVEAALEGDGVPRQIATAEFDFVVTAQDREDLRWYLEDYLLHVADPAPKIARRIEGRINELGVNLFKAIFRSNEDAQDLWAMLRERLNETRVEIITGVREATALPWELLRDPKTDTPLVLRAMAFVRAAHQTAQRPSLPQRGNEPIRILLVICRPGGGSDVPFRSVASRLIKGLDRNAPELVHLDVLRPPTFAQLSKVLRSAKVAGNSYHVVHFDGHGTYVDVDGSALPNSLSSLVLLGGRDGAHGYLVFENPDLAENVQLVDGSALGKLLAETGVPVLVLNACRSAHAEPPATPTTAADQTDSVDTGTAAQKGDLHRQVRAFGSLAQEVVDSGVAGVVAMRYNVYVVTAAQFVADLYEALTTGQPLGDAVTLGRKQLEAQPLREIAYQPRPLQDWMVPIVYEAAPVALFHKPAHAKGLKISVSADTAAPASAALAPQLEQRPDAGFFGRDETLLALDRAFDSQAIVLLHAYAGSGKTSTAAEFARWYYLTGGIEGAVLFTSFEHYKPLTQLLNDTIGRMFGDALEKGGVNWLALSDEQRLGVALKVMAQVPVLWIWDNVEPIGGFPAGTKSAWSDAEQQALSDFLRAAKQTSAKFLLTSRRDERGWLGDLPARIKVPPMPMQERVQLARALVEKNGRRLADVEDWMPLLNFTRGNPMTITTLVRQALLDGLKSKTQIEAFVAKLRAGEAAFPDEAREGRDKSLGASLSYGFEGFSEMERGQLALLHLFQGFVNVVVLCAIGRSEDTWSLHAVQDLTREAGTRLLDRAADIGLLTALGGGLYSIHPAMPWFLKNLFERCYPKNKDNAETLARSASAGDTEESAIYAYVKAMTELSQVGRKYVDQGNRGGVSALDAEESNLLHALRFAKANRWHDSIIDLMDGIRVLYDYKGRAAEWKRLVEETLSMFVDEKTDLPLAGLDQGWREMMQWRGTIARSVKDFEEASRVFELLLKVARTAAMPILAKPAGSWTDADRSVLSILSNAIFQLGTFQMEALQPSSVSLLTESYELSLQLNLRKDAALSAFHLGHAYMDIAALRDLNKAESWYRKALELEGKDNPLRYAVLLHELGQVTYGRFIERLRSGESRPDVLFELVKKAVSYANEALKVLPEDATEERMHIHHLLGNINDDAGEPDQALVNYREGVRLAEGRSDMEAAAKYCREIARCLAKIQRFDDALEYAKESLRKLRTLGPGASRVMATSQELIAEIEEAAAHHRLPKSS